MATGTSDIHLSELTLAEPVEHAANPATEALPRPDTGRRAWSFLAGCYFFEMILWTFPFSFGVFQNYYTTHEPISSHAAGVSAIGTTCSGVLYLFSLPVFAIYQRYPAFLHQSSYYGLPLMVAAMLASSFATQAWHLILTQGVLYAIGGGLLYYPVFIFIDQWFIRKKGFAYGIMWAGSGTGGVIGPFLFDWGLSKYGLKTFLRGYAIAILIALAPFLYFVKARVPTSPSTGPRPRGQFAMGYSFLKSRSFWIVQAGNICQGLGYFTPPLYLPSYATNRLAASSLVASLPLSLINLASVIGVVALSSLSDHLSLPTLILISALGSTLAVFLLWGFSTNLAILLVFALAYGFFAGGFSSTFAATVKEVKRTDNNADTGAIFSLLGAGRGIGNIVSGPLSAALIDVSGKGGKGGVGAYSSRYVSVVVFTGVTAALALTPWFARKLKLM